MNTKIIKLDINKKMYETISAKQGDTESRFLLFHLFDSSLPFDLTEKSVRVYGIKPDEKKIFNDLVINDAKKGYCTLELTNQMLSVAGLVKLELVIYKGSKKLSSIPFVLNVISSLNSEDAVVSTNEFTALMNGLAALSEYDIYKSNAKQVPGIKEEVSNLSSQLEQKANLDSIFSMANMGQDVKEAMTGGSVAVVGKNAILEENIVKGEITPPTTSFLKNHGNLIDNSYFKITKGKYLNGNTGEIAIANSDDYVVVENFIPVLIGKTYVFNSAISWLYCYDSAYNFVSRVATTDCSSTWKRVTVPDGVKYVRLYCDKSTNTYTKLYLFEYDSNLEYGTNEPTEDKLPQTNYLIENLKLEDETITTIKEEVKDDLIKTISYKMIKDYSKLILNGCKVKLIGDSITAGQGGTNFNKDFNVTGGELITDKIWKKPWYTNDTGTCWANSLKDYLTQKFGCTVKNYGCPGVGVEQLILAIDDLVREDDELVICMIGTNNRHHFPIEQFYPLLKQLYEIITITKGKKCIMMSCMPASVENELSSNRIFHAEDIDNAYFKLACEYNFEYISIYKEVIKYCNTKGINVDTLLTSDGLHPNDVGYGVMFMIICMALGFAPKRDGATW